MPILRSRSVLSFLLIAILQCSAFGASAYKYLRLGNKADAQTRTVSGSALMGGGTDLDDAFRWLCERAGGGDFLILRARGDDDYNPYVNGLCKLNSVATLIIPDRESAQDPAVAEIVGHAEAVFIAGGDQARYVNFWKGTPVEQAINRNLAEGKPVGGTSAGLAILGQFGYGALGDKPDDNDLASKEVLANPFMNRVTLVRDFLKTPHLENTITDTHFAKRDRMGRTLGFLARLMKDGWSASPREIAVDERSAVLVDENGRGTVVGSGKGAYFLRPAQMPTQCEPGKPLSFANIAVYRVPAGGHFDLTSWSGTGGTGYALSVENGIIHSTQADRSIY
jgi:cyanophycinase